MKRIAMLAAAGFLGAAPPALAQHDGGAQPVRIVITKTDCSRLIRHVPADDVAYRPGVDARGRAVAPADMPGSGADAIPNLLPEVLEFPITINPVGYGARNQAQREKAAAAQGQSDTYAAKSAAQAQLASLNRQKTTLTATAATQAGQKAILDASYATAAADLAALQAQVDGGTLPRYDRTYTNAKETAATRQAAVAAKQKEMDATSASLTATNTAITAQQAIIDGAPAKDAQYTAAQAAADAKLARLSSKGLDSTTMQVGTVRYDMAKGAFTFNGQPLGSAEQAELARACQKQGVR